MILAAIRVEIADEVREELLAYATWKAQEGSAELLCGGGDSLIVEITISVRRRLYFSPYLKKYGQFIILLSSLLLPNFCFRSGNLPSQHTLS